MENQNQNQNRIWSTWEELLLACAVKRHGYKDWDSISVEIQARSSLPHIHTTAHHCKLKYYDLKRRFTTPPSKPDDEQVVEGDKVDDVPWLEELRKLRVAELKQEVQRYDVSILSLQSKVKRLEEEREREKELREETGNRRDNTDLEEERLENDKGGDNHGGEGQEVPAKVENRRLIPGEDSDRENRSVNGSNSTGSNRKAVEKELVLVKSKPEPVQTCRVEAQPVLSGSNSKPEGEDESVMQLSSDVQSSLSLGSKRKRKVRKRRDVAGDSVKHAPVKSEPLIQILHLIRSSQHGSLFERRLESQETEDYKITVKQHLDLRTIQTRLDQGSYKFCFLSFYRDLLLLFNNAVVFFPKSSRESLAASELLALVSAEMKKETQKSDSTQKTASAPSQPKHELHKSDSLLARQKSSAPIVVCRKRSSISSKSSLSSGFAKKVYPLQSRDDIEDDNNKKRSPKKRPIVIEQQSLRNIKSESMPITGTSSRRKGSKLLGAGSSTPNKKKTTILTGSKTASKDKVNTVKSGNKKAEALALEKKKGAADFLKRIKMNSLQHTSKKSITEGGISNNGGKKVKGQDMTTRSSSNRKQAKDEGSPSKRSVGRPRKKAVEVSTATRRRGREDDGNGTTEMKPPSKRSRRR